MLNLNLNRKCVCFNDRYDSLLGLRRVANAIALAQGPRPSEARPCEAPKAPSSPCNHYYNVSNLFMLFSYLKQKDNFSEAIKFIVNVNHI